MSRSNAEEEQKIDISGSRGVLSSRGPLWKRDLAAAWAIMDCNRPVRIIDLIATQWGVTLEDTLSQDDLGSLRTEGSRQRRQTELDGQLRQQLGDVR
jgi:hypothetical protein